MKLIVCDACHDVVALQYEQRACLCGQSAGKYGVDGRTAFVRGPCHVLGLDNKLRAGFVDRAEAWLIPEPHPLIRREHG